MAHPKSSGIVRFAELKKRLAIDFGGAPFLIDITEDNVRGAFSHLETQRPQVAFVLDRYYGITGKEPLQNMPEIAAVLGVTIQRVQQIVSGGIRMLRTSILKDWKNILTELESQSRNIPKEQLELEQRRAEALAGTIDLLNLKVRTRNCLIIAGMMRIVDVIEKDADWYLGLTNFGRTSLKDLQNALHEVGLHLKQSPAKKP